MNALRSSLSIFVAASLLAASSPSLAAPDHVDELYATGQEAFKKHDYEGARRAYLEAWGIKKSYDIAGNLGNVEMLLKRSRDAAEHLSFALELFPPTGHPDQKAVMEKLLAEATRDVGRVRVSATLPDLDRAKASLVRATVNGAPVQPKVNGAKVEVVATPEHSVLDVAFVDPDKPVVVEVWIDGTGYDGTRDAVKVHAGAEATVAPQLQKHGPSTAVIVAGTATAVGAAVAGIVLLVAGSGAKSDAAALKDGLIAQGYAGKCPGGAGTSVQGQCSQLDSKLGSASTEVNAGGWLLIGAGALGVATVLYATLSSNGGGPKPKDVAFAPVVGPSQAGLLVRGSF